MLISVATSYDSLVLSGREVTKRIFLLANEAMSKDIVVPVVTELIDHTLTPAVQLLIRSAERFVVPCRHAVVRDVEKDVTHILQVPPPLLTTHHALQCFPVHSDERQPLHSRCWVRASCAVLSTVQRRAWSPNARGRA